MAKELAIVLNNGSINSAVTTALAAQRFRLVMLHMILAEGEDEGAETATRSRVAFDQQTGHYKPYREHVLELSFLTQLQAPGGPKKSVEGAEAKQQSRMGGQLLELLPLVAAAARFAAHYHAVAIYFGLRAGSAADDLAQASEYVQIWQELLQLPCGVSDLEFTTPLLEMEPWQVVDLGIQVNVPFDRTWSCVTDAAEPCWACKGCRTREAAFHQAGKPDPLRAVKRG
ncbi:MAG TPA: 7-cyano-7-deazaguanine synthase [Tepidisphaeraceae bacterium]|jgi:7-cyano-7-deazaguanine synthase